MQRKIWCDGGAALLGAIALCLFHVPRLGAMELLGQAGMLGEWELTGNLTEGGSEPGKEFFGPLKMKHVGICTQEARVTAKLVLDGVPCTYSARKTHAYEGTMSCEGRAPVPLLVWLK